MLVLVVILVLLVVGLSIEMPEAVPRLAILPRPAGTHPPHDDCHEPEEYNFERQGLFWVEVDQISEFAPFCSSL